MSNDGKEISTKHLLHIATYITNPGYLDDPHFESSYEYIENLVGERPHIPIKISNVLIQTLYPDLKEPIEEFTKRLRVSACKKLDDNGVSKACNEAADIVIEKYKLPQSLRFGSIQEIKNNSNLQKVMKDHYIKSIQGKWSPIVVELASRFAKKINDYDILAECINTLVMSSHVLKGRFKEDDVRKNADYEPVAFGLALLQLKKEGVITENEIVDMNKFNQSKAIKNFMFKGEKFDLSGKVANNSKETVKQM